MIVKYLKIGHLVYILILFSFFNVDLLAKKDHIGIGIDEQLGAVLDSNLVFTNSKGEKVNLGNVITKPTLLAFVYYTCPGICSNTLTQLAWVADRVDLVPGEDFEVVTISINPTETPAIAAQSKKDYLTSLRRKFPSSAWTFLVGDSLNIYKATSKAGVYFEKEGKYYRHPGGIISISPQRKISRYIYGSEFNQFDVKMALIDAKAGKTNPTIAKLLQICFSYDPQGKSYTLNVTRIVGAIMLLGVGLFAGFLTLSKKIKKRKSKI